MRRSKVMVNHMEAGVLEELQNSNYKFTYHNGYHGAPISLTMPIKNSIYEFNKFPPFFEGLLPEGIMLEALLRKYKLEKNDFFGQLLQVGQDVVGAITIEEVK